MEYDVYLNLLGMYSMSLYAASLQFFSYISFEGITVSELSFLLLYLLLNCFL